MIILQSYSLQKLLKNNNQNIVKFIDIIKNEEDNKLIDCNPLDNKKALKQKILKIVNKDFFIKVYLKPMVKKQTLEFEKFRNEILEINQKDNEEEYDTCVIGSDEVFNCSIKSNWGFTSQLFGNVLNAKKVITYAACCGITTTENISKEVKEKIQESFKNISHFSVRDNNTYNFVKSLSNKKDVTLSLDPVVVGDFDEEIVKYGKNVKLPKKYCIVYSYYNRINKKEDINAIKKFCKEQNMEIITIGSPQIWNKNFISMNPFEVLYAFSKADFVITDTFHGTIFSAKYAKKFAVLVQDSNKFKLKN